MMIGANYLVDPKIVIKIHNISTLQKNMYALKYSILNSYAQNPAISTFFRKVHSDVRNSPDSNQPSFLLPSLKD